ncbi:MAG: hypothetical protein Q9184_001219 [Pyrenodesmia sp. 2 TL-2023]
MAPHNDIVLFHYSFSPFAKRIVWYLTLRGIEYAQCLQPPALPREDINALGVKYRRIPIMSIGRDIYCDTRLILEKLEERFPSGALGASQPDQKALEKLLEQWTVDAVFARASQLIPPEMPVFKDPRFRKDREEFMGRSWEKPDVIKGRPEALVHMRQFFELLETTILADGRQWVLQTDTPSLADIHESLDILVVTFNCGRKLIRPEIFARHLSNAIPDASGPEIIVLSLQEIAPVAYSFLGGSYLIPYFFQFHHAIRQASKAIGEAKYVNIVTRNVGMTACMVFVHEGHKSKIQWVETAGVGVGVQGMGNKGAVGVKLGYAATGKPLELAFVAAHLAPMEDALDRRNEDWMNIVRGLVFTPVNKKGSFLTRTPPAATEDSEPLLSDTSDNASNQPQGIYTPTSHLILAGDLNYRTSPTLPRPSDHLAFPKPTSSTTDPQHYSHLLRNDQLAHEVTAGRTCHSLREAPIDFPPTYKYSSKAQSHAETEGMTADWGWAKHRWPSWCDRILFLDLPPWMKEETPGAEIKVEWYTALPLMPTSDHRPVALRLRVPLKAISAPPEDSEGEEDVRLHPPIGIDPRWRERRAAAHRKEVVVGLLAYLFLTWEGNGILLALVLGTLGGWAIVRSQLDV